MAILFPDTTRTGKWDKKVLQTVNTKGSANETKVETITATGGTRTLTFNGQTTGALAYNANAATIQAALEGLSNLAPGDVGVSGTGGTRTYVFAGVYLAIPVVMTVNTGSLTGGTSTVATTVVGGALNPSLVTVLETNIKRENTQDALRSKGLLRSSSQVQNDNETFNARKPKDIGDPARIVGEG